MSYTTKEQVKIRLKQFHIEAQDGYNVVVFDRPEADPIIEQLIDEATKEVITQRMYPEHFTMPQIEADLDKFEFVIVNLAVYDFSQAGENYMSSYSENGTTRTWKEREKLLSGVCPYVKVL